jgi:hypothetical protein
MLYYTNSEAPNPWLAQQPLPRRSGGGDEVNRIDVRDVGHRVVLRGAMWNASVPGMQRAPGWRAYRGRRVRLTDETHRWHSLSPAPDGRSGGEVRGRAVRSLGRGFRSLATVRPCQAGDWTAAAGSSKVRQRLCTLVA